MVKSVLGVNHQGLRDWIIQRVSAVYMAIFTISLLSFILCHSGLTFVAWQQLFAHVWMKVATVLFLFLMLFHTWVGIWTVGTDYVKPFLVRVVFNLLVLFMLGACFVWGIMILWSV
jgi:succinate dehydrogenase / fumarate reductase, membrane anchor subunit